VVVVAIPETVLLPEDARVPLQPPLAEQLLTLVELQLRVLDPPLVTAVGLADRDAFATT
jgi:hypothetical protein